MGNTSTDSALTSDRHRKTIAPADAAEDRIAEYEQRQDSLGFVRCRRERDVVVHEQVACEEDDCLLTADETLPLNDGGGLRSRLPVVASGRDPRPPRRRAPRRGRDLARVRLDNRSPGRTCAR